MNNKDMSIYRSYMESDLYSIYECYNKPSIEKVSIYNYWRAECNKLHGNDFRIVSYNKYVFTLAFKVKDAILYVTPTQVKWILLDYEELFE